MTTTEPATGQITGQVTDAGPPPTQRVRNPVVLVIAVLFVLGVAVTGAVQVASQVVRSEFEKTTTLVPQAERLIVDASHGDVELTPSTDGKVTVRSSVRYGIVRPELTEDSTPTGVRLDARCDDPLAARCEIDYTIAVPASFAISVTTSGDVSARGFTGPLDIAFTSGDVDLADISGPLVLQGVTGDVRGAQLRSPTVRATTWSGDIRLDLREAPHSVTTSAGSGEIDVVVPGGVAYRVAAHTGTGERVVAVPQDPASERSISADTGSGDIRIEPVFGPGAGRADLPALPVPPPAPAPPPAPPAPPLLPSN